MRLDEASEPTVDGALGTLAAELTTGTETEAETEGALELATGSDLATEEFD